MLGGKGYLGYTAQRNHTIQTQTRADEHTSGVRSKAQGRETSPAHMHIGDTRTHRLILVVWMMARLVGQLRERV